MGKIIMAGLNSNKTSENTRKTEFMYILTNAARILNEKYNAIVRLDLRSFKVKKNFLYIKTVILGSVQIYILCIYIK